MIGVVGDETWVAYCHAVKKEKRLERELDEARQQTAIFKEKLERRRKDTYEIGDRVVLQSCGSFPGTVRGCFFYGGKQVVVAQDDTGDWWALYMPRDKHRIRALEVSE